MNNNIFHFNRQISFLIIFLIVIVMSIGYAAFSANFMITNSVAYIRSNDNTRIIGIASDSAHVTNLEFSASNIFCDANIPNGGTVTFQVTVDTLGNVPKALSSITVTNNGVTLNNVGISPSVTNGSYIKVCNSNDVCILNAPKDINIQLVNNTGNIISSNNFVVTLTFTPYYTITYNDSVIGDILDDGTFTYSFPSNTPNSVSLVSGTANALTLSGDTLTITNVTSDLVITGTFSSGGGGNITPEAEEVIEEADPGETIPIQTVTSTETISIATDSSGNITTGFDPNAQGGAKFYLLSTDYIGYYKNRPRPASTVTFGVENITWKVWDRYDNKLILISASPTTASLSLIDSVGYNNGIYFMNSIIDSLYGGAPGIVGRNLRMSDIEKKMMEYLDQQSGTHTYTDSSGQAIMSESNLITLRRQIDASYATVNYTLSNSKYRTVPVCHGTASTMNFYSDRSIWKLDEVGDNVPTTDGATSRSTVVATKLFYSAATLTNYLSSADRSMLNLNNSTSFWIATRVMNATAANKPMSFGYRRSNGGAGVTNAFFASSDPSTGVYVSTYTLRPVLEIDLTQVNVTLVNGSLVFS